MKICALNKHNKDSVIAEALAVLQRGGLIIFPTETTYGLGADATNPQAIERLMEYKSKRVGKALSIAVSDQTMAEAYVELNPTARRAYREFLPGPVTVISVGKNKVAKGVESETGTLGVRIPDYALVRELVQAFGKPMTATSANASNQKRPYKLQDIWDNTSEKQRRLIDLAIDAGELPPNEPSTVIDTTLDTYSVVRQGTLSFSNTEIFTTNSAEETQAFGGSLVRRLKNSLTIRPVLLALEGEMGAGKTQLVKGIAKELHILQTVTSPTYTLVHEYPFTIEGQTLKLVHVDAWRLLNASELLDLGLNEHLQARSFIALEWANSHPAALRALAHDAQLLWLKLEYGPSENTRTLTLHNIPLQEKHA